MEERHVMDSKERRHRAELLAELMTRFAERYARMQKQVADTLDLTVAEVRLLRMFEHDTMLASSGLARRLGLSNSRMTRILDGMVAKSLVRRSVSEHDRRVLTLTLSPKGRVIRNRLTDMLVHTHGEILDAVPEEHRLSAITFLQQLSTALSEAGSD